MISLNKYDLKQIKLVIDKLQLFENKKIDLFDLVNDLNGLLNAFESVSNSWKNNFQSEVNALELINDSFEDGSISRWQGNIEEDLYKIIKNLKQMASNLLEKYLMIPDPKIEEIAIEGNSKWLICPSCNDAWESISSKAMVVCPKCDQVCHNPRYKKFNK